MASQEVVVDEGRDFDHARSFAMDDGMSDSLDHRKKDSKLSSRCLVE